MALIDKKHRLAVYSLVCSPSRSILARWKSGNSAKGAAEELLLYPHAAIRIFKTKESGGAIVTSVSTLHRDAQGSLRALTTAAGVRAERMLYRPFGEATKTTYDLASAPETKGYIGERFDADAGCRRQSQNPRPPG